MRPVLLAGWTGWRKDEYQRAACGTSRVQVDSPSRRRPTKERWCWHPAREFNPLSSRSNLGLVVGIDGRGTRSVREGRPLRPTRQRRRVVEFARIRPSALYVPPSVPGEDMSEPDELTGEPQVGPDQEVTQQEGKRLDQRHSPWGEAQDKGSQFAPARQTQADCVSRRIAQADCAHHVTQRPHSCRFSQPTLYRSKPRLM